MFDMGCLYDKKCLVSMRRKKKMEASHCGLQIVVHFAATRQIWHGLAGLFPRGGYQADKKNN
ncbi:hypothetical protein [Rhizobium sp. No.120]